MANGFLNSDNKKGNKIVMRCCSKSNVTLKRIPFFIARKEDDTAEMQQ